MTKFARDEFDRVPQNPSRQGVHRVVGTASRPVLWPVLVLGVLALVVGLAAFLFLPKPAPSALDGKSASQQNVTQESQAPSPSAKSTPSAGQGTSPSAAPKPTPTPTPTPSIAAVDKTSPVAVYNGAGVAGLAARVSGMVQADGWVPSEVGNWQGVPQQASVIFYKGAAQEGNAEALGKLLGITEIRESADYTVPLVVVLGPGYN